MRLGPVQGNADWIYAWVALLAAGADLVFVPTTSWLNVISPLYDHLFATFLLSGSLRFVGLERHLRWLWIASSVICLLRLTIQPFMPLITGALSATVIISFSSCASCWLLFRNAQEESLPATRVMSFAFLAPGGVQFYFLISRMLGDIVSGALFAYVVMSSMLAMAQLTLLLERARRETERNRETLALMAQTAPVGLCLTDQQGYLEAINPVARQLLKIDVVDKLHLPDFLENQYKSSVGRDQMVTTMRVDDAILQVIRRQIPVGDRHVGEIWFIEDISARVQLGELIPKAASLETIKNIAANIAHVFNNKLTVISGNAELMAMTSDPGDQHSVYFEHLNAAIDECNHITQDFLLLTQAQPAHRKPIDLHQTIADLNNTTQLQISSAGDSASLDVDPTAFSRAFKELLTNSEEAGASEVTVGCTLLYDGFVQLSVCDNGRGLDGRVRDRLFEPFFTTKEHPLGSGLGLSVVDSIVRAHGGRTDVSPLSEGVEISMTWPVAKA